MSFKIASFLLTRMLRIFIQSYRMKLNTHQLLDVASNGDIRKYSSFQISLSRLSCTKFPLIRVVARIELPHFFSFYSIGKRKSLHVNRKTFHLLDVANDDRRSRRFFDRNIEADLSFPFNFRRNATEQFFERQEIVSYALTDDTTKQ